MKKTQPQKPKKQNRSKSVTLCCRAPGARSVFVAGSFNEWHVAASPLKPAPDGTWSIRLKIDPGQHEFKFLVDGQWCCDPERPELEDGPGCVPNSFGTSNRVLRVDETSSRDPRP